MAKSIITQNGSIVNYSNLLAVYVEADTDDEDRVIGYDLLGAVDNKSDAIVLGSFNDENTAENAKADIIRWLQSEAFSTFEMPAKNESGDA